MRAIGDPSMNEEARQRIPVGKMIDGQEQMPYGTPEEENAILAAISQAKRYEAWEPHKMLDPRDIKRITLLVLRNAYHAGSDAMKERAAQAADDAIGASRHEIAAAIRALE